MKRFKKVFDESQESQIKSMQAKLDKIDDQTEALKDKIARLRDLRKTATVTDRIDDNIKAFKAQIEKLDKEHARYRGVIKQMRNEEINEAVEVDDISVGKKKKKPAGIKADEPLKGYAYNEKMKFKFKGKKTALHIKNNQFLESAEELDLEESKAELVKTIEAEIKKYGPKDIDTPTYKDAIGLIKKGDQKALKKLIYTSDTEPSEFLSYAVAQHDPAAFKKMYPRAKAGDYLRSIVIQHGESVDEIGILKDMMEEIDIDEALSPAMKKKRLALIKKAVEKINRQNAEKAKKDALKMMKDSGMFDENLDENQYIGGYRDSSRDGQGPKVKAKAPELSQIEQLQKKLESMRKQRQVHDDAYDRHMEKARQIRKANPKDLGGIHNAEGQADKQQEMGMELNMKIQDVKDDISVLRDRAKKK